MQLYIRALTFYPNIAFMYLALLLLDVLLPFAGKLCKLTSTRFISNILPTHGWRITYPFRIDRDNTHYVTRRGNCVPLMLYMLLCLLSMVMLGYTLYVCWGDDLPMYALIACLQLTFSTVSWCLELKQYMSLYKRTEHLRVIEICQCCSNAFLSILLLEGYHGDYYTYVVPNTEHWQVGAYHEASCTGSFIDHLNPDILEDGKVIWVGVGDKTTYKSWNAVILPTSLLLTSAAFTALYVLTGYVSTFIVATLCFLLGILYIPWPQKLNLRVIAKEHTECFGDIHQECCWTFVLVNKSGRPFYYQTDDGEALCTGKAYTCKVSGSMVKYVESNAPKQMRSVYHPKVRVREFFVLYLISLPIIVGAEYLGWIITAVVTTSLLTLFTVGLARYLHKGDI